MTPFLPPPQYDVPPSVPVIEHVLGYDEIVAHCGDHMGCTVPNKGKCEIWVLKAGSMIVSKSGQVVLPEWMADILRRHELAHCNGWPKDHPK